jgi:branched-chain amino acid transport system ATP-binding protein
MALLEVRGVTKRFGGLTALDAVDLTVDQGEILGLIGPNGAGKTTLFHVISGFLRPEAGEVRFGGRTLRGLPPYRICRLGLARTFQVVQPFVEMSVLDNVAVGVLYGQRGARQTVRAARAEAERVLELVQLRHLAAQPAAALNLSERKRLELARALATGPELLCLDEVMSGLTPAELERLAETAGRLNREVGVSILMIEHNVRLVTRVCRRVVVLNYGQVIADGAPGAVMRDPQVVAAYLGDRAEDDADA